MFKKPVPTSQKTHSIPIANTNRIMLFWDVITVYCEDGTVWAKLLVYIFTAVLQRVKRVIQIRAESQRFA
jgi:hypothetical protein